MDKARFAIKAYHPDTGTVHDMAPKDMFEFIQWVQRGIDRGYKAYDLGDGIVRFNSNKPGNPVVFTVKLVINAKCAMDYVNWCN